LSFLGHWAYASAGKNPSRDLVLAWCLCLSAWRIVFVEQQPQALEVAGERKMR